MKLNTLNHSKTRYSLILLFAILSCHFSAFNKKTFPILVGDKRVFIQVESIGTGKTLFHLHQNEQTALKAARIVIRQQGGRVYHVKT